MFVLPEAMASKALKVAWRGGKTKAPFAPNNSKQGEI
jgi:hypothetical protein